MENKNYINSKYVNDEFEIKFKKCWQKKKEFRDIEQHFDITNYPFNCAALPNFIQDEALLQTCLKYLKKLHFQNKNNDLYKFKTSKDLSTEKNGSLGILCNILRGPIKNWVEKITKTKLSEKVAIGSSKYEFSDVLLCHDDELEDRRIAFILYLTTNWQESFGGSLDLFSVNDKRQPKSICKRIHPEFGTFAFFEVSPVSYHQVSEIIKDDAVRISINGWFHGKPIVYPSKETPKMPIYAFPGYIQEDVVYSWINPIYLDEVTQSEIRENFQNNSEIQLPNFLKIKKFKDLCSAVENEKDWSWNGPPNDHHFEVLRISKCAEIIKHFYRLMSSEAIFLILSQLTGVELHHLAPQSDGRSNLSTYDSSDLGPDSFDDEEDFDAENALETSNNAGSGSKSGHLNNFKGQKLANALDLGSCDNESLPAKKRRKLSDEGTENQPKCSQSLSSTKSRLEKEENFTESENESNSHSNKEENRKRNEGKNSKRTKKGSCRRKKSIEESKNKTDEKNLIEDANYYDVNKSVGGLLQGWSDDVQVNDIEENIRDSKTRGEMRMEARRWRWGSYSLMKDDQLKLNKDFVLDVSLFCLGSERDILDCNKSKRDKVECNESKRHNDECNESKSDKDECSESKRDKDECNELKRDKDECNESKRDKEECNKSKRDKGDCNELKRDKAECTDLIKCEKVEYGKSKRDKVKWSVKNGGSIIYVAQGEDEELMSIVPSNNSLAIVYRDNKTFRFTKHINAKSQQSSAKLYHEFYCEYRELENT